MNNSSADDRTFSQKFHRFAQSVILSFFFDKQIFLLFSFIRKFGEITNGHSQ